MVKMESRIKHKRGHIENNYQLRYNFVTEVNFFKKVAIETNNFSRDAKRFSYMNISNISSLVHCCTVPSNDPNRILN